GVGLDDVGAGLEEAAMDVANDVGPREREQIAVVEQVFLGVAEALAADVGFAEPVAADGGPHGAVDDDDALAQQLLEWMQVRHGLTPLCRRWPAPPRGAASWLRDRRRRRRRRRGRSW